MTTPGQLFGRQVIVDLGTEGGSGVRLTGLRVSFHVEMTRSSDPHKGTIKVWNPAPSTIGLMQAPRAAVRLFVGYDVARLVFFGTPIANGVRLDKEGPDTILVIEAKDGGRAYAEGAVSASFGGSTSLSQVLDEVARQLGVPRGTTTFPDGVTLSWPRGIVLAGSARSVLDRIAAGTGTTWMITDGALVIIPADGDTGDRVTRFSSRSGNLIGAPSRRSGVGVAPGGIEVKGLLDASMRPGRPFVIQSAEINGTYIARDVTFEGDSGYESPFYVSMTGDPLTSGAAA